MSEQDAVAESRNFSAGIPPENFLPDPIVPAEVDLRDFAFLPLDVRRLRDSDLATLESPEACWAAVLLWAASWHQKPAASLPDDDRVLAKFAGYGRVIDEWLRVKAGAMRGWIRCSDGRFYHPVVAEKAMDAWLSKQQHSYDKCLDRLRKENKKRAAASLPALAAPTFEQWRAGQVEGVAPGTKPAPESGSDQGQKGAPEGKKFSAGIPPENALKGQGQGQGQGYVNKNPTASPDGDAVDRTGSGHRPRPDPAMPDKPSGDDQPSLARQSGERPWKPAGASRNPLGNEAEICRIAAGNPADGGGNSPGTEAEICRMAAGNPSEKTGFPTETADFPAESPAQSGAVPAELARIPAENSSVPAESSVRSGGTDRTDGEPESRAQACLDGPPSVIRADDCPHEAIVAAYHTHLPMGRQVRAWTEPRRRKLRARWREDKRRQKLEWWERFFRFIGQSDFLAGRVHARDKPPFEIALDWIIEPRNFLAIIEGKYHREAA